MSNNDPQRPITLKDIAKAVGVHPSTVSRAMRNDPHISQNVRERIKAAAETMSYKPNPFVSAFTAQVRNYRGAPHGVTIAMLDYEGAHLVDDRWQKLYIEGIGNRAQQLGYKTEIISLSKMNYSVLKLNKMMYVRGIRGLIILPVPETANFSDLNCKHMALATISYSVKDLSINRTSLDYYQCMMLILNNLQKKRYKRIGFAIARSDLLRFGERLFSAFVGWQQTLPLVQRIPVHINDKIGSDDETAQTRLLGRHDFEQWVRDYRPEVVIGSSFRFYKWLLELNFNIPDDIGFAATAKLSEAKGVSCVDQNHLEIGAATIDLIVEQFHRNEYGPPKTEKTVMIEGRWVEGHTLKQLN